MSDYGEGRRRMGTLVYESMVFEFEDRLLAHLQVVIVNKLRRRESFVMPWRVASDAGSGRAAIWLDPSIPLYFEFEGSRIPSINREWLARLGNAAESSVGLVVIGEDGSIPVASRAQHRRQ
ncbi:ATP-dependent DNA ligase [Leifsonia sp. NPDC077715]|uniref:DUF7882 family protein n=1 Tax=Leifsonia sp. NPDC077715 TaxID=3155539 RepID=UPI003430DD78